MQCCVPAIVFILLVFILLVFPIPQQQHAVAEQVEKDAVSPCFSTASQAAFPCNTLIGEVVCWHLRQCKEDARLNYCYFQDDLDDMRKYAKTMELWVKNNQHLITNGEYDQALVVSGEALGNAQLFLDAVKRGIKHEAAVRSPTFDTPFWSLFCWLSGCPYIPAKVDDILVKLEREMAQVLPNLTTIQMYAEHPEGYSQSAFKIVQDALKEEILDINTQVNNLNDALKSETEGVNMLVTPQVNLSLGSSPTGAMDLERLANAALSMRRTSKQQRSQSQAHLYLAGVLMFAGCSGAAYMAFHVNERTSVAAEFTSTAVLAEELLGQGRAQGHPQVKDQRVQIGLLFFLVVALVAAGMLFSWF